jgi:hypothetical protein
MVARACLPSYVGGIDRRMAVQAGWGIKQDINLKHKAKMLWAWLKW